MDMETQFLHDNFTEKDSKLFMEHIQRMAFGEAPFFATTLSLVYDKLVEKAFAQPVPSGSGFRQSVKFESVADPSSPLQPSNFIVRCTLCRTIRTARRDTCQKIMCGARFV